jgi:hypothetical protein
VVLVTGAAEFVVATVGGYLARSPVRGLLVVFVWVLVVSACILTASCVLGLPLLGSVIAGFVFIWLLLSDLLLVLGLVLGGFIARIVDRGSY